MLQTYINSSQLRCIGSRAFKAVSKQMLINAGNGVRLEGFLTRQTKKMTKGLVILLHGWEGSANSAYVVDVGQMLFNNGFDVFRLNLRDHGQTHHLNPGLFLGTLIDEATQAVRQIADMYPRNPVFLAGFSMGANYAIRIALKMSKEPNPPLQMVISVNPPLDPHQSTLLIDKIPSIRRYFIKKWHRSLRINQEIYPELYDFTDILKMTTCMDVTETLTRRHSPYHNAKSYFRAYSLTKGVLDQIELPLTIIMSRDDPVIDVKDFETTPMSNSVNLLLQPYGGHCGYISDFRLTSWVSGKIVQMFDESVLRSKLLVSRSC